MFSETYIAEMFKPQEIMAQGDIFTSFIKLINASVMVLNKYSMEKLFDLMIMGTKREVLNCCHPRYYVDVFNNIFLDNIQEDLNSQGYVQN